MTTTMMRESITVTEYPRDYQLRTIGGDGNGRGRRRWRLDGSSTGDGEAITRTSVNGGNRGASGAVRLGPNEDATASRLLQTADADGAFPVYSASGSEGRRNDSSVRSYIRGRIPRRDVAG